MNYKDTNIKTMSRVSSTPRDSAQAQKYAPPPTVAGDLENDPEHRPCHWCRERLAVEAEQNALPKWGTSRWTPRVEQEDDRLTTLREQLVNECDCLCFSNRGCDGSC